MLRAKVLGLGGDGDLPYLNNGVAPDTGGGLVGTGALVPILGPGSGRGPGRGT